MEHYDYYTSSSYSLENLYAKRDFLIAQYKQRLISEFDYENQLADIDAAIELQTSHYC